MMNTSNNSYKITKKEEAGKEPQAILDTVDTHPLEAGHSSLRPKYIAFWSKIHGRRCW